ncbi:MAG: DUF6036 family nucleotidyltransferase [Solirubrobacterales bacterium]
MRRADLEHVIGAAANVLGEDAFVVIGSQAILGPCPDAPATLLRSMEVDLFPMESPERAAEIDAALGDGSPFHEAFGYYAHGVGPETAKAPTGWQDRLIEIDIPARVGSEQAPKAYCLEPHDLVLAKCAADRDRDWEFAQEAIKGGVVEAETLSARVDALPLGDDRRISIRARLEALNQTTA